MVIGMNTMKAEYGKKTQEPYSIEVGKINFRFLCRHFIHEGSGNGDKE